MKLVTIGLTAAALLAGSSIAMAESSMAPGTQGNSAAPGKCWNAATNTVQDKAQQGASGQKKAGGVTTGSGTSGNATNSTGQKLQTRPAGMPSC
jgi:hypothetical protein